MQNARPPLPSTCPTAFSRLISRCWSTHPDKRPHFDEIVHILESYAESLEQDPDFFSSYKPPSDHTLLRCFPKWIGRHRSASWKSREIFFLNQVIDVECTICFSCQGSHPHTITIVNLSFCPVNFLSLNILEWKHYFLIGVLTFNPATLTSSMIDLQ